MRRDEDPCAGVIVLTKELDEETSSDHCEQKFRFQILTCETQINERL